MTRMLLVLAVISQSSWAQPAFPRERLARLLGLSLKDTAPATPPPVVPSALACQVLGTLQSRDVQYSLANVQCGRVARSFHVGDALEDGVIEAIGYGVITVRRGERLEELGRGLATTASLAPPAPPVASRASLEEGRVPRALIDDVMKNPAALLGELQLMPAFSAGKFVGVRAHFVKEGSLVATLGLKKGDVIRAVNGKPLDSLPAAFAALQLVGASGDLEVQLDRGGQALTRTLHIE